MCVYFENITDKIGLIIENAEVAFAYGHTLSIFNQQLEHKFTKERKYAKL